LALSVVLSGPTTAAVANEIDSQDRVWIYGQKVSGLETCWGAGAKPSLQVKRNGNWVTIAKGKMTRSEDCAKKHPLQARYTFTLEDLGTQDFGERTHTLELRTVSGKARYPFTKTVYKSREDHSADLRESFYDLLTR
jgi:hypothetical protein